MKWRGMKWRGIGRSTVWALSAAGLLVACGSDTAPEESSGGSSSENEAQLEARVESIAEQSAFVEQHDGAESALGNFSLEDDGSVLRIQFGASGFQCDGPQAGEDVAMQILELSEEQLLVSIEDEEMLWTRQGSGEDIYGTWAVLDNAGEPEFLMSLEKGGEAVISGLPEECDENDSKDDFTEDGCLVGSLESGASIQVDGYLEDWQASKTTSIRDATDDSSSDVMGDEISELQVTSDEDNLYLLLKLDEPLSENFRMMSGDFRGAYNISIRHNARGGGSQDVTVVYQDLDEATGWRLFHGDEGQSLGVADQAIEIAVSWSALGNPSEIYEIRASSQDCGGGPPCEVFDEGPCFAPEQ